MTVTLTRDNEDLILRIEDDGKGFDESAITPGYGLRSIRDRARLSGAKLMLESHPGKGTTLMFRIPEGANP